MTTDDMVKIIYNKVADISDNISDIKEQNAETRTKLNDHIESDKSLRNRIYGFVSAMLLCIVAAAIKIYLK